MLRSEYSQLPKFTDNLSIQSSKVFQKLLQLSSYPSTLRNIPEEQGSHLHRGESLVSPTKVYVTVLTNHSSLIVTYA
jgi:hypothetical protein